MTKLQDQGMEVDARTALPYLREVGGYRMKGYWYQWQDPETKLFRSGTDFDQIIERYEFDRELRRIAGDALQRIELMVRATMSNVLSKHEGPHWFTEEAIFLQRPPKRSSPKFTFLMRVQEEVERTKDKPFIAHYRKKYDTPSLPPSWAISECLTFGSWSHAYAYLAKVDYAKQISRRFGVELPHVFASWLHAFSVLRNTVAHHGRLLGSQTSVTPADYRDRGLVFSRSRTFFVTATVINYVCQRINQGPRWKDDLEVLFAKFPSIPIERALGFPPDWPEQPGWRQAPIAAQRKPRRHKRGERELSTQ